MDGGTYLLIAHVVVSLAVAVAVTGSLMVREVKKEAYNPYRASDDPPPIVIGTMVGVFWPILLIFGVLVSPFVAIHYVARALVSGKIRQIREKRHE